MSLKKLTVIAAVAGVGLYAAKKKCGCSTSDPSLHDAPTPESPSEGEPTE